MSTRRLRPTSLPETAAIVLESGEKPKLNHTGLSSSRESPPVAGITRSVGRVLPRYGVSYATVAPSGEIFGSSPAASCTGAEPSSAAAQTVGRNGLFSKTIVAPAGAAAANDAAISAAARAARVTR